MSEIRKEKVFAYNWVGEALYFVIFREEGNVLSAVRTDGRLEEEVRLPRVYDNVYDMIAVLENGKTRVAVGVGERGLFAMYFDLRDGSMSCESFGSEELWMFRRQRMAGWGSKASEIGTER